MDLVSETKT